MTLNELNQLPQNELQAALARCCGASDWVKEMASKAPFQDKAQLYEYADTIWECASEFAWLEAFTHHPKIGVKSLEKKFTSTKNWSKNEQSGVQSASKDVIQALAQGNIDYESKFGYIFIVCATGKSAQEMLALLQARLPNDPKEEMRIAMKEQQKITRIRLDKLFV